MPPDRLGASDVRRLLDAAGVRPSRHRGQNFLVDPNVAERIVTLAEAGPADRILEVGVGVGSLTAALLATGASVVGVEIDENLARVAEDELVTSRLELVVGDASRTDWTGEITEGVSKMVSNLPYAVGTRVLVDVVEQVPDIERFVVMVQREVGERLCADPGDAAYGAVSLRVAYFCEARLAGRVGPTVFYPRPEVDSVLVDLRRIEAPVAVRADVLFRVVDAGFAQRRKTLRRALSAVWPVSEVDAALSSTGIEASRRAETLDLGEFAAVADALHAEYAS